MILKTTRVEDWDRFMAVFSTESADKRRALGCRGVSVYRDPNDEDRVWAIFDWTEEGWAAFVGDPTVPPMMQRAGHKGRPQAPVFVADLDA